MTQFELGKKIGVKGLFVVGRRKKKLTWWQIFSAWKCGETEVFFLWLFFSARKSGELKFFFLWLFLSAKKSCVLEVFFYDFLFARRKVVN